MANVVDFQAVDNLKNDSYTTCKMWRYLTNIWDESSIQSSKGA